MSLPTSVRLDCTVQRDPNVIAAEADRDLVMVSISSGFYYGVSDVAREIWEAIERPVRVSELVDYLMENYGVDRAACENETLKFLEDLLENNLIKISFD